MLKPKNIWLARKPVDMRQGRNTLTQYISTQRCRPAPQYPRVGSEPWGGRETVGPDAVSGSVAPPDPASRRNPALHPPPRLG